MPLDLARYSKTTIPISMDDFSGGLNFQDPPRKIADNEFFILQNFEYDILTGKLRSVDGLSMEFDASIPVDSLYFDQMHNIFLFPSTSTTDGVTTTHLYKTDLSTKTLIGDLTGLKTPHFNVFKTYIIICSGNRPQYYDGTNLTTITATFPDGTTALYADLSYTRNNRLVIVYSGQPGLYHSGVRELTNWNFAGTDSDAQEILINADDGLSITAVVPLSQDIIVFKSDGKSSQFAFRVSGEYPDWVVNEVSRTADCANKFSAVQAFNDVFYLGNNTGFTALTTVQEYGAVKIVDVGAKINSKLVGNIGVGSATYRIPTRNQIWLIPDSSGIIYIYNLQNSTFTSRRMTAGSPTGMAYKDSDVYISRGNKILKIDSLVATDDGAVIRGIMKGKEYAAMDHYIIKQISADIESDIASTGTFSAGIVSTNFNSGDNLGMAAVEDDHEAMSDSDPAFMISEQTISKRCNCKCKSFGFSFIVETGIVAITRISAKIAEVS